MRIDLEQALTDIAASVEDDVVAERLGGRVHHMVTRVRRRRAARHAMQGAVGVGTAAAVAVVGVNVAGTGTGTDSAAPTTSPGPTQDVVPASRPLACGQAAPEPTTPAVARGLELELTAPSRVAAGDQVTVEGRLHNRGDAAVPVAGWSAFELVAVADGRVVGTMAGGGSETGALPADGRLLPGDEAGMSVTTLLASCDEPARTLNRGEYLLLARTVVDVDGDAVQVVSEPAPLTVVAEAAADDHLRAVEAVESYVAMGLPADDFPTCGATMPERGDEPLVAEVSLLSNAGAPVAPGSVLDFVLSLRSTDHRTVLGMTDPTAGGAVLLKDGVVVGGVAEPPGGGPELVEVDEVGIPMDGTVHLVVCGSDHHGDEPLPLPPGEYELVATASVALKEILDEDTGEATSDSRVVVAWSEPEPLTVE